MIMKKLIELTPEWVLENLPDSMYADGYGTMSVYTENPDNASWISLALNTLKIPFSESEFDESDDWDDLMISYKFKIEDIKADCPSLYEFMKNLDRDNLQFKLNKGIGLN